MEQHSAGQEHSILGPVTVFTAILVVGLMWTVDATGAWDLPDQVPWAIALGILGIGLLVGAFAGRARWLLWICIPVAFLALAGLAPSQGATTRLVPSPFFSVPLVTGSSSATVGVRLWRPVTVSQIPDEYALGVGTGVLDLTALDLPVDARAEIGVRARVDMGTLQVRLPAATRVVVDAQVGMGTIDIAGAAEPQGGMGQALVLDLPGRSDSPTLKLQLSVGMGTVEVSRAATSP